MTLVLSGISKVFETKRGTLRAVDDVTFEFNDGRLYTILGPSGCGKTTLLRMIAGFEQPSSGDVIYAGTRINDVPPYRRGFPMVFQSYALFPHMSVLDNVTYGLRVRAVPANDRRQRALRMLELLGLESHQHHFPAQLSGGQQQRVALARALVLEPDLILLDEPLSNLDAGLRVAMRAEIRALQQRLRITAIYVTHDQEEALAISDEIVVMNQGRIEQAASPVELYHRPATEFVARFMGCPNVFDVQRDSSGALLVFGVPYGAEHCGDSAQRVMIPFDAVRFGSGRHQGIVETAVFVGSRMEFVLLLDGDVRLTVHRPTGGDLYGAGARVTFALDAKRLYCF